MALKLTPPDNESGVTRRERICLYGPPSAGKSYAWQRILASTPSDVEFHVIDTDGAWEPAAASEEFAEHVDRVHHTEPVDWPDYVDAMKFALKTMDRERGDWLVIDMADDAWEAAQDFYSDRRFEGDSNSLEFFQALVDGTADDEDPMAKWGIINKLYAPFAKGMIKVPGNLLVCATAKELKKDSSGNYFRESRQNIRTFGQAGARPGGQKNLAHDVNTVLSLSGGNKRTWSFEKIKDRNRDEAWEDETSRKNNDFAKDFLLGVCGWVPVAG